MSKLAVNTSSIEDGEQARSTDLLDTIQISLLSIRIANKTQHEKGTEEVTKEFRERLNKSHLEMQDVRYFYKTDDPKKQNKKTLAGCVIKVKDSQGKEAVLVSYHGTRGNNWGEIKADLKATKGTFTLSGGSTIETHKGFLEEYKRSSSQMQDYVTELSGGKKLPITFAGHSLGGALSQIAALDLTSSGQCDAKDTSIVTFGSPRVFSKEGAQAYSRAGLANKTLLVRQKSDIVPRVPPKGLFAHIGFKLKLPNASLNTHGAGSYRKAAGTIEELKKTGKLYSIRETDAMQTVRPVSFQEYLASGLSLTSQKLAIAIKKSKEGFKSLKQKATNLVNSFRKSTKITSPGKSASATAFSSAITVKKRQSLDRA